MSKEDKKKSQLAPTLHELRKKQVILLMKALIKFRKLKAKENNDKKNA